MDALIEIKGDVFDIAARLREIDPRYKVYRNMSKHRFEIHANGALQVAVPFDRLDARALSLVRETRLENADELLKRLESHNERTERDKEREARDRVMAHVEEVL